MAKTYKYILLQEIKYFSKRYGKWVTVPFKYHSDGATGAMDIQGHIRAVKISDTLDGEVSPEEVIYTSLAWWVHDKLCDSGKFDDGSLCTNWQASRILSDILKEDGHKYRQYYWLWSTWLFGGGEARKNGMW